MTYSDNLCTIRKFELETWPKLSSLLADQISAELTEIRRTILKSAANVTYANEYQSLGLAL